MKLASPEITIPSWAPVPWSKANVNVEPATVPIWTSPNDSMEPLLVALWDIVEPLSEKYQALKPVPAINAKPSTGTIKPNKFLFILILSFVIKIFTK